MSQHQRIDNLDRNIIAALQLDARTPYAELGKRFSVSPATIHVRVENLFDQNFNITNDYNFGPRQARGLGVFGGVTVEF